MRSWWSLFASLLPALLALAINGTVTCAEPPAQDKPKAPEHLAGQAEQQLWEALREGNLPLLKVAIAERADVNGRTPAHGLPPLLELLRTRTAPLVSAQRECVACLLAHGVEVNVADGDRRTPVIYAARSGDLETLRLLVEAEAYVRTRDRFHKTALFYAVEADRRDIVVYLAQNGALISLSVKERRQMGQR
jgi:hypothetical protein